MTTPENAADAHAARDLESDIDADAVEALIALGKEAALANNTRKTYDTGWRSWTQWASGNGLSVRPADPEHLQIWLATLVSRKKKPTTVRTYLASVAERHISLPGPNPAHDPHVRQLLAGLNRTSPQKGARPDKQPPYDGETSNASSTRPTSLDTTNPEDASRPPSKPDNAPEST